jgi:hypothetical protein
MGVYGFRGRQFKSKLILVASLLGGGLVIALVLFVILLHELLHLHALEVEASLERLSCT